jgi:hypothetical protein
MAVSSPISLPNWLKEVTGDKEKYCGLLKLAQATGRYNVGVKDLKLALESESWKPKSLLYSGDIHEIWVFLIYNKALIPPCLELMTEMSAYQKGRYFRIEYLRENLLPMFCLEYYMIQHQVSRETAYNHLFGTVKQKVKRVVPMDSQLQERKALQREVKVATARLKQLKAQRRQKEALSFVDEELRNVKFHQQARTADPT